MVFLHLGTASLKEISIYLQHIPLEEIQEMCKYLSKEAAEDVMQNGYKDGNLIYKNLKTETLIEIVDPEASKILIVGTGKGTRVFIDDVSEMED